MELASHGYVVASLDHPYHSFFKKDTTGKTITVDKEFFQTALSVGGSGKFLCLCQQYSHAECIDTMNGIILRFYDCYLKYEGEFSVEESY